MASRLSKKLSSVSRARAVFGQQESSVLTILRASRAGPSFSLAALAESVSTFRCIAAAAPAVRKTARGEGQRRGSSETRTAAGDNDDLA